MKFPQTLLVAALVLLTLGPAFAELSMAAPVPPQRCTAYASSSWANGPTPRLRIEAFSDGPNCEKAVVVFVVRDSTGKVLFNNDHEAQFVATLAQARTRIQMQAALRDWIDVSRSSNFHSTLPNWASGATLPTQTEFAFIPHDAITRTDYVSIRTSRKPFFCYVQGMESLKCLVYRNDGIEDFGIQAFPG
jgi:hypothetical protein